VRYDNFFTSQVKGSEALLSRLQKSYTEAIKDHALPQILKSVSPIRTFVNIGGGLLDLVLLPMEQYQKDGRLIKGKKTLTMCIALST
jgi:autophagy-related protein 2